MTKVKIYDVGHGFPMQVIDVDCPSFERCKSKDNQRCCRKWANSDDNMSFICISTEA